MASIGHDDRSRTDRFETGGDLGAAEIGHARVTERGVGFALDGADDHLEGSTGNARFDRDAGRDAGRVGPGQPENRVFGGDDDDRRVGLRRGAVGREHGHLAGGRRSSGDAGHRQPADGACPVGGALGLACDETGRQPLHRHGDLCRRRVGVGDDHGDGLDGVADLHGRRRWIDLDGRW